MFAKSAGFCGYCSSRWVNNHINGNMSKVFVTVGTTCFDDLIVSLTSHEVVEVVCVKCILACT